MERSGGIAGMVRRWSAPVPDDGGPAARAAHRIAELSTAEPSAEGPETERLGADGPGTERPGKERLGHRGPGHRGPGRVRDGFVWAVRCGEGSLQCDEEGRRRDTEVDALITVVTAPQ